PVRETPGDRGRRDVRTLHDVGPPPLRDDEQDINGRALRSEFHESHGRADRAYRRYAVGVPGRLSGPRGFSDRNAGLCDRRGRGETGARVGHARRESAGGRSYLAVYLCGLPSRLTGREVARRN